MERKVFGEVTGLVEGDSKREGGMSAIIGSFRVWTFVSE